MQRLSSDAPRQGYADLAATLQRKQSVDQRVARSSIAIEGIGIDDEDREWLFEAFHRGRNVGNRPGTGLGLVIVKRCVDLHRGNIFIDSRPGQGTRVMIRLPVFE